MLTDDERRQAATIQQQHARRVAAIRSDAHLSPQGKRARIAAASVAARDQLAALRHTSDARNTQLRRDLEFKLFGVGARDGGTDILAARDARDRASRVKTPAEAAQLLASAQRVGDTSMARAVFEHCWNQLPTDVGSHWAQVGASYLDGRPQARTDAEQLAALLDGNSGDALRDRLSTELLLPAEVSRGDLNALAREAENSPAS
jgi:hypothetical protein